MQPHIIIEKKVSVKPKKVSYEVFHILQVKDLMGEPAYVRQSMGTTDVRLLEAEIKDFQIQIDYRNQLINEIKDVDKRNAKSTDYKKALEAFKADVDVEESPLASRQEIAEKLKK